MGNIMYRYRRPQNGYPGRDGTEPLTEYLARHHIFSYPFMLTFAVVTLHYLATPSGMKEEKKGGLKEKTEAAKKLEAKGKLEAFYRDRGISDMKWMNVFNKEQLELEVEDNMSNLVWICWAEPNLFIGPSGDYRGDDASQKMENMPLSFPSEQRRLAEAVYENWAKVSTSKIVGNAGEMISVSLKDNNIPAFVDSFLDYICYIGDREPRTIYQTLYSDWTVKETGANSRNKYNFIMNINEDTDKTRNFVFCLREDRKELGTEGVSIVAYGNKCVLGKCGVSIEKSDLEQSFC